MAKDDNRGKGGTSVVLVEKHGFTQARCACGWSGPGRRSRKKARADAATHAETCKKAKR